MKRDPQPGAVLVCLLLAAPSATAVAAVAAVAPPQTASIDHVADGDTFTLRNGEHVRIIGIDAPEEYFGKRDCGSKPAAALLTRLLTPGTRVTLRRDTIQPNRDRYDRLLRCVARAGIPDVGLAMIRSGWAGVGLDVSALFRSPTSRGGASRTTRSARLHASQA